MSRLFDFIHHHGCRIADERAKKAHPDYADRERRREEGGSGNTKLMSNGDPSSDLSVESFFDDMTLRRRHQPWWHTATLHLHWWMQDHGPGATKRNIVAFWQRGKRGWSDRDTWNFDNYLAKVIRDGVQHLNDIAHGWPGEPMTFEEWKQILTEISAGMQAHLDLNDLLKDDKPSEADLLAARNLALDHLKAHWGYLWD